MSSPMIVTGKTNREFFAAQARPGRIGFVGGAEPADRLIARAQRHLNPGKKWSLWSHVFIFQGQRADGHHWVFESDLDMRRKHIRLGVQENRIGKYDNDDAYPVVGVIDLGLTAEQTQQVLAGALALVATGTRYSLREIVGTVWALRHPQWQPKENLLAQEQAFYCSAFVRHVLDRAGVNLAPTVAIKNTTPEHLWRMTVPHAKWLLAREHKPGVLRRAVQRIRSKLRKPA